MSKILFTDNGFSDYLYWLTQDKKTLKRIYAFLKDFERNGIEGIGKPDPLKGSLSWNWSRRIDETNRLVYKTNNGNIEILSCKGHYDD